MDSNYLSCVNTLLVQQLITIDSTVPNEMVYVTAVNSSQMEASYGAEIGPYLVSVGNGLEYAADAAMI